MTQTFYAGRSGAAGVTSCHRQNPQNHIMPKKTKQPKAGKITSISVSRLYNLGNYQNIKYDLTATIGPSESSEATFRSLHWILQKLKPLREPECKRSYEEAIKLTQEKQSEYQRAHVKEWAEEMAAWTLAKHHRSEAVRLLDDLGGTSTYTDHKASWDDDEPF